MRHLTLVLLAISYVVVAVMCMKLLAWEPKPLPVIEDFEWPINVGSAPSDTSESYQCLT